VILSAIICRRVVLMPDLFIVANDNHEQGNLTSWYYDSITNSLTLLDSVLSKGSCAHIAVSPDGTYIHIANLYANGQYGSNAALVPINCQYSSFTLPS
jgi:6-phosphogluconolactonase (cycloisomerase 2 family)